MSKLETETCAKSRNYQNDIAFIRVLEYNVTCNI